MRLGSSEERKKRGKYEGLEERADVNGDVLLARLPDSVLSETEDARGLLEGKSLAKEVNKGSPNKATQRSLLEESLSIL